MKKLLAIIVLGLLFSGCTPYAQEGFLGGFSSIKISDNTYRVSYAGNGYVSFETVKARAKLRGGEIASANGFDYLKFANSEYYRKNGITYSVRMYKFSEDLHLTKDGKVKCKIESANKSKIEAEEYVRNKLASCSNNDWHIVNDIPKIYGHAR
jgi:hypothetical protein